MYNASDILNNDVTDAKYFLFEEGYVQINKLLNQKEITLFEEACTEIKKKPSPFKIYKQDGNGEFFMDFNNWSKNNKLKVILIS